MKFPRIAALSLAALAFAMSGAAVAQYYNTLNYMVPGGADWEVGGTLNIQTGGKLSFNGVDQTAKLAAAVANPVGSPTAGVRAASGEVALNATPPTVVATGLTTITSCLAALKEATISGAGLGTSVLTYTWSSANLSVYDWKPTSNANPTLVASSGTETIGWTCWGT